MNRTILIFMMLILNACATAYQPRGSSGGYSNLKLGNDMYQVSFQGNRYTNSQKVLEYFLKRCADLTIEQGFSYFEIINQEHNINQRNVGTVYNGNINRYNNNFNYFGTANNVTATSHSQSGIIKLYKSGTQSPNSYNASDIVKALEERCAGYNKFHDDCR